MSTLKPNGLTEKELVKGVLGKDLVCQEVFFNRYAGVMMTVCRRYARHRLEAEDILQDSFIKAFNHLHQFKFEGSLEGWIRRIVVTTAIKWVGKKSFTNELYDVEVEQDEPVEPLAISNLNEEQLLSYISELPDGYKLVFNMFALEGYSHKEIAKALGIKESTSRSQLTKARRMLQTRISEIEKLAV